jgi:hypothetical protein
LDTDADRDLAGDVHANPDAYLDPDTDVHLDGYAHGNFPDAQPDAY